MRHGSGTHAASQCTSSRTVASQLWRGLPTSTDDSWLLQKVNPLRSTLKPQSYGPLYSVRRRRHWCTEAAMTAWSSLAYSVLMWCLRSSRHQSGICVVLYTLSCSIPHTV